MIRGNPASFDQKARFRVLVDGFVRAAFTKCSELKWSAAKIEHYEGGAVTPHKQAGRLTYADITLERGVSRDQDFYLWTKEVGDAAANGGLVDPAYKRHLDIQQLDAANNIVKQWTVFGAFPIEYTGGDWDNTADEVVMEKITLTIDSFERTL